MTEASQQPIQLQIVSEIGLDDAVERVGDNGYILIALPENLEGEDLFLAAYTDIGQEDYEPVMAFTAHILTEAFKQGEWMRISGGETS